jgi:hypothetical protein
MSENCFDENSIVTILHPPYSPDLVPSNFGSFGHIKTSLAGPVFNDVDKLLEGVVQFLNKIQPSELQFVLYYWIQRVNEP